MKKFLLLTLLVLTSCDNPKSKILPSKIDGHEAELKTIVDNLSEDEKGLLTRYLMANEMRKAFGGENLITPTTTVDEALKTQRNFEKNKEVEEKKQQLLKEEVQKQRQSLLAQFNEVLTASFISKKLVKADYQEFISFKIAFKNNASKEIRGIKGVAIFTDIFDDPILKVNFSDDHSLKTGESYVFDGGIDYNQFRDEHQKFAGIKEDSLKFKFEPSVILFKDGSKLAMPDSEKE